MCNPRAHMEDHEEEENGVAWRKGYICCLLWRGHDNGIWFCKIMEKKAPSNTKVTVHRMFHLVNLISYLSIIDIWFDSIWIRWILGVGDDSEKFIFLVCHITCCFMFANLIKVMHALHSLSFQCWLYINIIHMYIWIIYRLNTTKILMRNTFSSQRFSLGAKSNG